MEKLVSTFGFNFNLRRYSTVSAAMQDAIVVRTDTLLSDATVGRCRLTQ